MAHFALWSWSIVSYTALCHGQLCALWSLLLSVTLCHVEHSALEPFGYGALRQWIIVPCLWSVLLSVTLCHVVHCAL